MPVDNGTPLCEGVHVVNLSIGENLPIPPQLSNKVEFETLEGEAPKESPEDSLPSA